MYRYLAIANYEDRFVIPTGIANTPTMRLVSVAAAVFFRQWLSRRQRGRFIWSAQTTGFVVQEYRPASGGGAMSVLKLIGVLLDYPQDELWQHGENCC